MKRIVPLLVIVLAVAPADAGASRPECAVAIDAGGDNRRMLPVVNEGAAGPATDIESISFDFTGDAVEGTLSVGDVPPLAELEAAGVIYGIEFLAGDARYLIDGWVENGSFVIRAESYGSEIRELDVTGAPNPAADTVTFSVPMEQIVEASSGGVLTGGSSAARADATLGVLEVTNRQDWAPDSERLTIPLEACGPAGTSLPDQMCSVFLDPAGDSTNPDRDITGLSMGVSEDLLVVDVALVPTQAPPSDGWINVAFSTKQQDGYSASMEIRDGRESFGATAPEGVVSMRAAYEPAAGSLRFEIDREGLPIADGDVLEWVTAESMTPAFLITWAGEDFGGGENTRWHVSPTCSPAPSAPASVPVACPVVGDQANDAGILVEGYSVPRNEPSLDLTAVGAESDVDTIRVSARVTDLAEGPPRGFDGTAWTISWTAGDWERWAAQAYRASDGTVAFGYALVEGDPQAPTGVIYEGTATTGSLDTETGVVSIDVPRAAVRAPESGELENVGASTIALQSGNSVGAHKRVDTTGVADYRIGLDCSA